MGMVSHCTIPPWADSGSTIGLDENRQVAPLRGAGRSLDFQSKSRQKYNDAPGISVAVASGARHSQLVVVVIADALPSFASSHHDDSDS